MEKYIKSLFVFVFLLSWSILFVSCGSDKENGPATIKFTTAMATYAEDKGDINIEATLSAIQSEDVVVSFSWAGTSKTDTAAFLGGDFNFLTPTSFTIKKGQTKGNLQIQIVDDTQIDVDDKLTFALTGATGGSTKLGSETETKFDLVITNNDNRPSNAMQTDLVWHTGANDNINDLNLDLYLQYNVSYTGSSITDKGVTLASSRNTSGFETLSLKSTDTDQKYFIVINFTKIPKSGSFYFTLNGLGYSNMVAFDKVATKDAGYASFWGPFTKSGSNVSGRVAGSEEPKFYRIPKSQLNGFN